jgi:hypothetical protein
MATVPMIGPDGTVADVPQASVQQALQAGAKPAADMVAPDGSRAAVPLESVRAALKAGARPHPSSAALVAAASVSRPANPLQNVSGYDAVGPVSNDVSTRIGNRIESNLQGVAALPGQIYQAMTGPHSVDALVRNVKAIPANIKAQVSQYRDPANVAGDVLTAYIGGKALSGAGAAPETTAAATDQAEALASTGKSAARRAVASEPAQPVAAETSAPPLNPELAEGPRTTAGAGPRVVNPEIVTRGILEGFDNKTLVKIAKSRSINVTAEQQLKPTVGNGRIISKILDSMESQEKQEIYDRWVENTRMGLPKNIGSEAYKTAALSTYFPDINLSNARLTRMGKAMLGAQR